MFDASEMERLKSLIAIPFATPYQTSAMGNELPQYITALKLSCLLFVIFVYLWQTSQHRCRQGKWNPAALQLYDRLLTCALEVVICEISPLKLFWSFHGHVCYLWYLPLFDKPNSITTEKGNVIPISISKIRLSLQSLSLRKWNPTALWLSSYLRSKGGDLGGFFPFGKLFGLEIGA